MFGRHLFLHDGARATSSLEIPADEVKNKTTALSFDIPPKLAKMLLEYRDRIAPKVIARRPERVFINADGSPKSQAMVAILIKTYLSKRAGIVMTPHQFRHLGAKMILEDQRTESAPVLARTQDDDRLLHRSEHAQGWIASPTPD
jgi:integrase